MLHQGGTDDGEINPRIDAGLQSVFAVFGNVSNWSKSATQWNQAAMWWSCIAIRSRPIIVPCVLFGQVLVQLL